MAGELDDAALGRERAAQDREAAGRLQRRRSHETTTSWPGRSLDRGRDLAERAAVDAARALVDEAGADELARDEADAARLVQVGGDVAAARLQVGDDRRARRDRVEVVELERDAGLARDREQVQHAVRRAAGAGDRGDRVLERLAREDRRRPRVVADEVHRHPPGLDRGRRLVGVRRRDAARGRAGEMPRKSITIAIVFAVNWPPQAPAPGHAQPSSSCTSSSVIFPAARAPTASNTSWIVTSRPAEAPGRDRAVVEDEPGDVEPGERHHRARACVLSQPTRQTRPSRRCPAHDELDRVGDHLARDQRGAHAGRAHRDAVRDGDRVELDRRAAGRADALLDVHGELALVQVARHRLDPRRRDADERLREILVGEADALQHRARRRAVDAVGEERRCCRFAGSLGCGRCSCWRSAPSARRCAAARTRASGTRRSSSAGDRGRARPSRPRRRPTGPSRRG